MQGNLRIQCMSSNIWIELIESPKKLIKATVSPPHNTQLLQDIKSKI